MCQVCVAIMLKAGRQDEDKYAEYGAEGWSSEDHIAEGETVSFDCGFESCC